MDNSHLELKRSNEPIPWLLFGFGGMMIAFALPSLIICLIVAGFSDGYQSFHILETISHWWGAGAVFLILFGAIFHSMHRLYHTLRDLKFHTGIFHKVLFYGLAVLISLSAAICLGIYYFSL